MSESHTETIRSANRVLIVDGDAHAVEAYFSPDYVGHVTEQDVRGHAGVRGVVDLYRRAFPDLQVDVEILVETGDRVAWQRTLRGTHQGAYRGFPATGRPTIWRDMLISRFRHGLIAEEWVVTDLAERLLLARKG